MGSGLRFCDFHLVIFKRDYGASRIIDQHSATSLAENRRIAGLTPNSPIYAAYSYTKDENGNIQTTELKRIPEGAIDELTQPMKKIQ
jgi:hypothetical protein